MNEKKMTVSLEECPVCKEPHKDVPVLEGGLFECPSTGELETLCMYRRVHGLKFSDEVEADPPWREEWTTLGRETFRLLREGTNRRLKRGSGNTEHEHPFTDAHEHIVHMPKENMAKFMVAADSVSYEVLAHGSPAQSCGVWTGKGPDTAMAIHMPSVLQWLADHPEVLEEVGINLDKQHWMQNNW